MDKGMNVLYLGAAGDARTAFGTATRAWDSETVVVSAYGDIDAVTAPELEQELFEAAQLGASRLVVDLTGTTFLDSSAIHALTRSRERFQASDLQLDIVCGSRQIEKVLEITGVNHDLPIHDTVQQAISHNPAVASRAKLPWPSASPLRARPRLIVLTNDQERRSPA